jgi:hypothetical protein
MDTEMFEHIASSITVKSICTPLNPDIHAWEKIEDLTWEMEQSLDADENNPWPVRDSDGEVVGMLWPDNAYTYLSDDPSNPSAFVIRDVMEYVHPHECVDSATTILDAVALFGTKSNSGYFYVMQGNEVVGILRYGDLLHPLGRLAFLTLALEIEDLALLLCQSIGNGCWKSLPAARKDKARDLFKQRYRREPKPDDLWDTRRLIECTQLVDKAKMIWKQRFVPAGSRSAVLGFFETLRKVRDRCAHPGGNESVLQKEELAKFVHEARAMRESLLASIRSRGIRREPRPYV